MDDKDKEIAELKNVLKRIKEQKHIDLGDLIYKVLEREGKGWEGKWVKHWGETVRLFEELKL